MDLGIQHKTALIFGAGGGWEAQLPWHLPERA